MGSTKSWILPRDPSAASEARQHVDVALAALPPKILDAARLLVSELVSNAVRHGEGLVVLRMVREDRSVRIEVADEGEGMPELVAREPLMDHGRGLRLLDALSATWGTDPRPGSLPGKRVWFTLETTGSPEWPRPPHDG